VVILYSSIFSAAISEKILRPVSLSNAAARGFNTFSHTHQKSREAGDRGWPSWDGGDCYRRIADARRAIILMRYVSLCGHEFLFRR
jgi:hypothetical protein